MTSAPLPARPTGSRLFDSRVFFWSLGSFLLLLLWDGSRLDLWLAHWFGSAQGFPLQEHWLWRRVLHDGIRPLPWLLELGLLAAIVWPVGTLTQLAPERRVQLALTTLLALLAISGTKLHSHTSCPWDLREFGGVATHVSHWAWDTSDGGGGHCFPAGHASAGFAFLGGFFAFRHVLPTTARRWLAGAMLAGFVLGLAQQVRGAHYMSHTFWTAWLCWATAALVDQGVSQLIYSSPRPGSLRVACSPLEGAAPGAGKAGPAAPTGEIPLLDLNS